MSENPQQQHLEEGVLKILAQHAIKAADRRGRKPMPPHRTEKQLLDTLRHSGAVDAGLFEAALENLKESGLAATAPKGHASGELTVYSITNKGKRHLQLAGIIIDPQSGEQLFSMQQVKTALGAALGSDTSPAAQAILDALTETSRGR